MSASCKRHTHGEAAIAAAMARLSALAASSYAPMCHRMASASSSYSSMCHWIRKTLFSPCPMGNGSRNT